MGLELVVSYNGIPVEVKRNTSFQITNRSCLPIQGGPLSVINGVITPISMVITSFTHLWSAIYRAYNPIY